MRPAPSWLVVFLACLLPGLALAQDRVALVIGNGAYAHAARLTNPANDAGDVAAALRRIGFDVVVGTDLDRRGMEQKVREFSRKLGDAGLALFFYAGHGLQVSGKNYLVPIDARLEQPGDLPLDTVDVQVVLQQMEARRRVNLVFLDACRDNPLARGFARSLGASRSTSVGNGLAPIQSAIGTMIAFATQPDNVALDGSGRNSPFTTALLKHIDSPNTDISVLMRRVRSDVIAATGERQVPWDHSSLTDSVMLVPAAAPSTVVASPPPAPAAPARSEPQQQAALSRVPAEAPAQSAVLYEEDAAGAQGRRHIGHVRWRTEKDGTAQHTVVATVEVPAQRVSATVSLRKNSDKSLPASHTIEVMFAMQVGSPIAEIQNVPGVLMKTSEAARGVPLAGLAVKVTTNFFLIGLSAVQTDVERNTQLLRERSWFDIPIVYANGKRAILAIEKGAPGEQAVAQAFAAWDREAKAR